MTPAWSSTPTCCARSPLPAGRRASTTARAAARTVRTARSTCSRWHGVPDMPSARSAAPAPETLGLLAALLAGDWAVADASEIRHRREEFAGSLASGGTSSAACARFASSASRPSRCRRRGTAERCCTPRTWCAELAGADPRARRTPFVHPGGAAPRLPAEFVPHHVAIVMDGNGRWANQRGPLAPRGTRPAKRLLDVVAGAIEVGVRHLSAYAFYRELEALAGRGPLPHGQPRRHPAAPRPAPRVGVRMRGGGPASRLWGSVIGSRSPRS